jgi:hypothetical protein
MSSKINYLSSKINYAVQNYLLCHPKLINEKKRKTDNNLKARYN